VEWLAPATRPSSFTAMGAVQSWDCASIPCDKKTSRESSETLEEEELDHTSAGVRQEQSEHQEASSPDRAASGLAESGAQELELDGHLQACSPQTIVSSSSAAGTQELAHSPCSSPQPKSVTCQRLPGHSGLPGGFILESPPCRASRAAPAGVTRVRGNPWLVVSNPATTQPPAPQGDLVQPWASPPIGGVHMSLAAARSSAAMARAAVVPAPQGSVASRHVRSQHTSTLGQLRESSPVRACHATSSPSRGQPASPSRDRPSSPSRGQAQSRVRGWAAKTLSPSRLALSPSPRRSLVRPRVAPPAQQEEQPHGCRGQPREVRQASPSRAAQSARQEEWPRVRQDDCPGQPLEACSGMLTPSTKPLQRAVPAASAPSPWEPSKAPGGAAADGISGVPEALHEIAPKGSSAVMPPAGPRDRMQSCGSELSYTPMPMVFLVE